ncbi:hypothetical protein [Rivularia sp. UHCC 0363]|uniref:hypothetical protein n=1 Tax=Rivularia sp. UHCC 0363 TaxID=3110244 RepID=UPI002B20AD73|nr:hypothetical protein [Rivularia sp. UHCC 0363]MEA5593317.1 hypothetical protein [Rivularia sp. UHCC 0363]
MNQDSLSDKNMNKTPAIKYLQNPFSIAWSKLAALTKLIYVTEENLENDTQSTEESEPDQFVDENEHIHLTDWVEPSIYLTIFCPYKR